jgi:flagellar basal-body rod modification protein FlgD
MATSTTAAGGVSGLGTTQLLQLLVAQLQNQDPLNPVTNSDFFNQLTSLNQVEGLSTLNANFSQQLQLQQLTQGSSLLGKTVNYTPTGGTATSGVVSAVNVSNGQIVLAVGSDQVSLSQITSVK